jgi:hypothetical protein
MMDARSLAEMAGIVMQWSRSHPLILTWLSAGSVVTFFGTMIAIPVMVARMPSDYFLYDRSDLVRYRKMHPAWRLLTVVVRTCSASYSSRRAGHVILRDWAVLTILIGITW